MKVPNLAEYSAKYSNVRFEREDGILEVTLHTKGEDIVWNFVTDEEVGYMFGDIGNDPENKVIILTGSGDTFIDKEDFSGGTVTPDLWGEWVYTYAKRLMFNLVNIPQPIIAAINGPARIHGEIGLLCDITLAAEHTVFQETHYINGLVPGDGVHVVWPMLLGLNRAKYFLITGQTLSARQALDFGLINEVLPKNELLPRARALARQLRAIPSLTVRLTREVLMLEMKRRMQDNLPFGLMMEGMAIMNHFPTEFKR